MMNQMLDRIDAAAVMTDEGRRRGKRRCERSLIDAHPARPLVRMRRLALERVRATVGRLPCERGGLFVSRHGPLLIEDFLFDDASDREQSVYYPNADYLNSLLERDYEPRGYRFVGVGHSHPAGIWRPSGDANWGDVKAAKNNLLAKSNADLPALFIPIIESQAVTGRFWLHPFVMLRADMRVHAAELKIED